MSLKEFKSFLAFLKKQDYFVVAPQKGNSSVKEEAVVMKELEKVENFEIINELPFYPFKNFLLPHREVLFNYDKNTFSEVKNNPSHFQALVGITIPDLKAYTLWNQVFAKDPYYQGRKKKSVVIGHSVLPKDSFTFSLDDYEENILEHINFDIFLGVAGQDFKVFTGSEEGQKLLDQFGFKDYQHIEFAGPVKEEGPEKEMILIKEKMKKHKAKIWNELGKRCIECGKCSIVCPTCFCFDLSDNPTSEPGQGKRMRTWTSCFYPEFSQVMGGYKFLNDTASRIHFWYEHKFVRIPEKFSVMGCVGCGRCSRACPADIHIHKVLEEIGKSK